jgi:hypothetical protein
MTTSSRRLKIGVWQSQRRRRQAMGDKSPKNTSKTNKQKSDKKAGKTAKK